MWVSNVLQNTFSSKTRLTTLWKSSKLKPKRCRSPRHKFPSSLPILRDATVRGLVKMYDFFQTPDGRKIVQRLGENVRFRAQTGTFRPSACMGKIPRKLFDTSCVKTHTGNGNRQSLWCNTLTRFSWFPPMGNLRPHFGKRTKEI
ncbi:hypothetical protein C8F04DRAFT_1202264 [Mycena alexandri]|uniref:Uncharacterized protein n=1 Tax=Mycena alexandri TaxID=1745969 RepID=A0AAD6WK69_9AGAR|nr:hypothetical protein C8F04DRAFT_1202264 [Mycena alexandri]